MREKRRKRTSPTENDRSCCTRMSPVNVIEEPQITTDRKPIFPKAHLRRISLHQLTKHTVRHKIRPRYCQRYCQRYVRDTAGDLDGKMRGNGGDGIRTRLWEKTYERSVFHRLVHLDIAAILLDLLGSGESPPVLQPVLPAPQVRPPFCCPLPGAQSEQGRILQQRRAARRRILPSCEELRGNCRMGARGNAVLSCLQLCLLPEYVLDPVAETVQRRLVMQSHLAGSNCFVEVTPAIPDMWCGETSWEGVPVGTELAIPPPLPSQLVATTSSQLAMT